MTTLEGERKDLNCYELTMLVMVEIFPTLNGREGESREFTYLNLSECLKSFVFNIVVSSMTRINMVKTSKHA